MFGPPVRPDYRGGSIVNLMRSIGDACGALPLPYDPLRGLDSAELAAAHNLILLVIDGLGADLLTGSEPGALLRSLVRSRITSVFPSTTASAVTSFLTGLAPQQHALTGWHMYFAELDAIVAVLPLRPREQAAGAAWAAAGIARRLFHHDPLFLRLARRCHALAPARILNSEFNALHCRGAQRVGFASLPELFERIAALIAQPGTPRYIYAYVPDIDSLAHDFGIGSAQVQAFLAQLDAELGRFLERIRGSDTLLLASADHGLIDAPASHLIELEAHPELAAMLARPLCGERRVAYCYVRPQRRADFEAYVRERFGGALLLRRSEEFIGEGWFGPGPAHPRLASRVGDYVLAMQDDWTIKDWLPGEKRHAMVAVHGGSTRQEMMVPLILARP